MVTRSEHPRSRLRLVISLPADAGVEDMSRTRQLWAIAQASQSQFDVHLCLGKHVGLERRLSISYTDLEYEANSEKYRRSGREHLLGLQ